MVGRVRLAAALKSGFTIRLTGVKAGAKLKLSATRSGKVVARGSTKATKKGTATVTLRFTAKAKRALRRAKSVTLKISGGGAATTVVAQAPLDGTAVGWPTWSATQHRRGSPPDVARCPVLR